MRFLYIFSVEESGTDIQDWKQDKREVVCNEGVGGPLTLKEDTPAAQLYHTKNVSEEECGEIETLTMDTTKQAIVAYQAA